MGRVVLVNPPGVVQAATAIVERRAKWADSWEVDDELRLESCNRLTGSAGVERCVMTRTFGARVERMTGPGGYVRRTPVEYRNHWVRVRHVVTGPRQTAPRTVFVGQIETNQMEVGGGAVRTDPTIDEPLGRQTFVAYGPMRILQKLAVSDSLWLRAGNERMRLGRMFPFNYTERDGTIRGNRADSQGGWKAFLFEGQQTTAAPKTWSNFQIAEHYVEEYANQIGDDRAYPTGAPRWRLSGTAIGQGGPNPGGLKSMIQPFGADRMMHVSEILAELIGARQGLDFVIDPVVDDDDTGGVIEGFAVKVFAVESDPASWSYNGKVYTYPENTSRITVDVSSRHDMTCEVEHSNAALFDELEIIGDPIKSTFSLGADYVADNANVARLWTQAREDEYKAVAGDADTSDRNRMTDRFRDVWQAIGADPAVFDYHRDAANPRYEPDGTPIPPDPGNPTHQLRQVDTDARTPMREGFDYRTNPPADIGDTKIDRDKVPIVGVVARTAGYVPVEMLSRAGADDPTGDERLPSADLGPLDNWIGARLRSNPNHAFAKGDWAPTPTQTNFLPSDGVSWKGVQLTLARDTDHRIRMGSALPTDQRSGTGNRKVAYVEALLEYMTPRTIVGILAGTLLKSPNQIGRVSILRDGLETLAREMPGLLTRFLRPRSTAVLRTRFLETWNVNLGRILIGLNQFGFFQQVKAPFTSVEWNYRDRTTTVRAGHADR